MRAINRPATQPQRPEGPHGIGGAVDCEITSGAQNSAAHCVAWRFSLGGAHPRRFVFFGISTLGVGWCYWPPLGAPRKGEIGKLRQESGILRPVASAFGFFLLFPPQWFRFSHLRVGFWLVLMATPLERRPESTGR